MVFIAKRHSKQLITIIIESGKPKNLIADI
jgi:hypothetical protein